MTLIVQDAADRRQIGFAGMLAYWLVQYTLWIALFTPIVLTIAVRISALTSPAEKSSYLGIILGVGALGAMIAAPVWGAISDRTRVRLGRRKTWIIAGSLMLLGGLVLMALAAGPILFGAGWLICQVGSNAAQAALNAVMSDTVPERRHGVMSALISGGLLFAVVTGVAISQFTHASSLAMFVAPWLLNPVPILLFLRFVPDAPACTAPNERLSVARIFGAFWVDPRLHPNFAWAFASRFLVTFGGAYLATYQVYFLTDHLHVAGDEVARYMVKSTALMGVTAFLVSLAGGWLSDRLGMRKPFVAGAALLFAFGLVGIAQSQTFAEFLVAVAIASVGQGLYYAVDLALCVEVLPDPEDAAKDMAVLQIASSLPQSLAPLAAPVFLAIGGGSNYAALFVAAGIVALLGAVAILPVRRKARRDRADGRPVAGETPRGSLAEQPR